MFSEINQMLRAGVPILVVAFGLIAVPATAFAHIIYDGDWSVLTPYPWRRLRTVRLVWRPDR